MLSYDLKTDRWRGSCTYNRIPFIWHPRDKTGAGLSNFTDYQTVHILTSVLTANFLLLPSQNMHFSIIYFSS